MCLGSHFFISSLKIDPVQPWSIKFDHAWGAGACLWGVDGIEEVGLRRGVVAPTGVAVLEGSTCNRGHFCSQIPHAD
jgi:hypothetical protein